MPQAAALATDQHVNRYPIDEFLADIAIADAAAQVGARFGDEVMQHLEFIRLNGLMTASGIPVIRYRSPERLYGIMAGYEGCGIMIANPHVVSSRTAAATSASMPINWDSSTRWIRWGCSTRAKCAASCRMR